MPVSQYLEAPATAGECTKTLHVGGFLQVQRLSKKGCSTSLIGDEACSDTADGCIRCVCVVNDLCDDQLPETPCFYCALENSDSCSNSSKCHGVVACQNFAPLRMDHIKVTAKEPSSKPSQNWRTMPHFLGRNHISGYCSHENLPDQCETKNRKDLDTGFPIICTFCQCNEPFCNQGPQAAVRREHFDVVFGRGRVNQYIFKNIIILMLSVII